MKTGTRGIKLIKDFEGIHDGDSKKIGLQPKMDPIGIWTEGWGRAMRDNKGNFIRGIANKKLAESRATIFTDLEATEALAQDLGPREHLVMQKIKIKITQNQFDALVSHVYNTGGSDTLFKLINQKAEDAQIKKWFTTKYITGGGIRLQGLVNRRLAEYNLFIKV